ncbi:bacitracin ABC transporter ATP-binding protein [Enterococcus silesiacus]|uniref:Bacitracin ABC transporter ATP-binding protein n=1 Tax=Enterococcus silesiacus TaxID=332949 RepID=A0A0S3K9A1_9ENTE|nr:ATP-binding cassette domain-containing protein [Enterococcus silesiacus]ALS00913.1 bacitracin ABC transporter ATP-binding protein [Enterococcus silesiacus]OJG91660.1 bacitracin ABC transporter ATP-binding protein [Enterococcus silesiacus]
MSNYLLEANELSKKYKDQFAVNRVNLHVKRGAIYGLVGKNGSGKTTLMRMLSGLAAPTSGEIALFGESGPQVKNYFSRIGILIETPGLYGDMSAADNLKLKQIAIGLYGKEYIPSLLKLVGLADVGKKKVKQYSLGMRQRLGIAMALIGEPDLLILDEPVNGLDPQGIVEMRDILIKLVETKNITIMISSHLLEELSKMATDYGFIHQGQLIREISHEKLTEECKQFIEIRLNEPQLATTVIENIGISNYKVVDRNTIRIYEQLTKNSAINLALAKANIAIDSITISQVSLEDYFLSLTGGNSRD